MGVCSSSPPPDASSGRTGEADFKVLLLGAGGAGKSTLFKQLCKYYGDGLPTSDQEDYLAAIHSNILESMRVLSTETKAPVSNQDVAAAKEFFDTKLTGEEDLDEELAQKVQLLWRDSTIQHTWNWRADFQISDTAGYFFERVFQFARGSQYVLTDQDMLRASVRTTGIVEQDFVVGGSSYHFLDVGGQRRERLKWGHCFKQVSGVVFMMALSGYEQTLVEDGKTNRVEEAVELFKEVCMTAELQHSSVVLVLNKKDILEKRLPNKPMGEVFTDYRGADTVEAAVSWIKGRFEAVYTTARPGAALPVFTISAVDDKLESTFASMAAALQEQPNASDATV